MVISELILDNKLHLSHGSKAIKVPLTRPRQKRLFLFLGLILDAPAMVAAPAALSLVEPLLGGIYSL